MKDTIVINTGKSSMRSWLWVGLIVVAIFLIVGFLHDQGYLDVKWQGLAIIIAAIAGPYKLIKNYITGGSVKSQQLIEKHKKIGEEERARKKVYDEIIVEKEKEIEKLQREVEYLDRRIEDEKDSRKDIDEKVKNMDLDEKQDKLSDFFGD